MDTENYRQVAVFPTEVEAQLAQATLSAAHIESYIQMDDAGRMLPSLEQSGGVKLLVGEGDVEEAKTILSSESEIAEGDQPTE